MQSRVGFGMQVIPYEIFASLRKGAGTRLRMPCALQDTLTPGVHPLNAGSTISHHCDDQKCPTISKPFPRSTSI